MSGGRGAVAEWAVAVLNEALVADPAAVYALLCNRVPCNETLAAHPTIQVGRVPGMDHALYHVGMLGVLNGVIEAATGQRIAAKYDPLGSLLGFVVVEAGE